MKVAKAINIFENVVNSLQHEEEREPEKADYETEIVENGAGDEEEGDEEESAKVSDDDSEKQSQTTDLGGLD